MKRHSPFSIEFWVAKGYTPEQADFERNKRRPIKKEYWIVRGYSDEESTRLAIETKNNNNKSGAKKSAERPKEELYKSSIRRIEHWIDKGYTPEEARIQVSKVQATFTLEKCIEKYGVIEGKRIWDERQQKWQDTLSTKDSAEIEKINKKKNAIDLKHFNTVDECILVLNKTRKMNLVKDDDSFISLVMNHINKYPHLCYLADEMYIKKFVSNVQKQILNKTDDEIKKLITHLFKETKYFQKRGLKQAWKMNTKQGFLRSSYEIYFYEKCMEMFPNIDLKIDDKYPNSNMRYDFYVFNEYIEICPMFKTNDQTDNYTLKMYKKSKLFGSILLKSISDIDNYLKSKICNAS